MTRLKNKLPLGGPYLQRTNLVRLFALHENDDGVCHGLAGEPITARADEAILARAALVLLTCGTLAFGSEAKSFRMSLTNRAQRNWTISRLQWIARNGD